MKGFNYSDGSANRKTAPDQTHFHCLFKPERTKLINENVLNVDRFNPSTETKRNNKLLLNSTQMKPRIVVTETANSRCTTKSAKMPRLKE